MSDAQPSDGVAVNRVEDFLTAFNAIERELKARTGTSGETAFKSAARSFEKGNP